MLPVIKRFPTGVHSDAILIDMAPKTFKKSYRKVPDEMAKYMVAKYTGK